MVFFPISSNALENSRRQSKEPYPVEESSRKSTKPARSKARTKSSLTVSSKKDDDQLKKDKLFLYFLQLGKSVSYRKAHRLGQLEQLRYRPHHPAGKAQGRQYSTTESWSKEISTARNPTAILYRAKSSLPKEDGTLNSSIARSRERNTSYCLPKKIRRPSARAQPTTEDELVGFVNRQLVTTSQSVKAVVRHSQICRQRCTCRLFQGNQCERLSKTFDLVKCRDVNNFTMPTMLISTSSSGTSTTKSSPVLSMSRP